MATLCVQINKYKTPRIRVENVVVSLFLKTENWKEVTYHPELISFHMLVFFLPTSSQV